MIAAAWVAIALDVAGAVVLGWAAVVLARILWSSIVQRDRRIGSIVLAVGLLLALHPALGIWWCLHDRLVLALVYSVVSAGACAGLAWVIGQSAEAAARP